VRALLRRVHSRLSGARASASGLITALRVSGLHGRELRLLLDELERFRLLGVTVAAAFDAHGTYSGPGSGPPYAHPAAVAWAAQAHDAPRSDPPSGRPRAAGSSSGANPDPAWPGSAGSPSASVGPAGVVLLSGPASMALLIGLALAGVRTRLRLTPSRSYLALVPAPLDRPG
jgi:hypothetical protein